MRLIPSLLACLVACGCSLNIEDPEQEALEKILEKSPLSLETLQGIWIGDSTFAVYDDRAQGLSGDNALVLTVHPDSSWKAEGGGWPADAALGKLRLRRDTLYLFSDTEGREQTGQFRVVLRFLGNYLELFDAAGNRFYHFHRRKPPDSASWQETLRGGLWTWIGERPDALTYLPSDFRIAFQYLSFSADSFHWEFNEKGLSRDWKGAWSLNGRTLDLGGRPQLLDLFHEDSLRLWPLAQGAPDSGYRLLVGAGKKHPNYLRVNDALGYWRADSVFFANARTTAHHGRYYDLEFSADLAVRTVTNMPSPPRYLSWSADSGYLRLRTADGTGADAPLFTMDLAGDDALRLFSPPERPSLRLYLSRIDGGSVEEDPLNRFPDAPYAHLFLQGDTLRFYFFANYSPGSPERFEIADAGGDTLWLILTFNPEAENFAGTQPGFEFSFRRSGAAGGHYRARAGLDLVIRRSSGASAALLEGEVSGQVVRLAPEAAPGAAALDTHTVTGRFLLPRRGNGSLRAPIWSGGG